MVLILNQIGCDIHHSQPSLAMVASPCIEMATPLLASLLLYIFDSVSLIWFDVNRFSVADVGKCFMAFLKQKKSSREIKIERKERLTAFPVPTAH